MSERMKVTKGRDNDGHRFVQAESLERRYSGPQLSVWAKGDAWLYLSTGPYEGTAMVNLECLPALISVLRDLEKSLKKSS
jgi:hypothetical protein